MTGNGRSLIGSNHRNDDRDRLGPKPGGHFFSQKKKRQPLTRLTLLGYTMDEEENTGDGWFPVVYIM